MRTRDDIFTQVLVRNNRTTTDTFITDAILQQWYISAHKWAASFHKWPFTEGRISTTYTTGGGEGTDEWSLEGYKADSFRMVIVGGKRLEKLNYEDYRIMREETPDSNDRVYSDFERTLFVNPNADVSGTLWAYGQYEPVIDITDEAGITIFTDYDEEGNEAVVEKMSCYLKRREHLVEEAELHDQRAIAKLQEIWKRVLDEQHAYKTHPARGGMWKWFDIIDEGYNNEIKRDQF